MAIVCFLVAFTILKLSKEFRITPAQNANQGRDVLLQVPNMLARSQHEQLDKILDALLQVGRQVVVLEGKGHGWFNSAATVPDRLARDR